MNLPSVMAMIGEHVRECKLCTDSEFCEEALVILQKELPDLVVVPMGQPEKPSS